MNRRAVITSPLAFAVLPVFAAERTLDLHGSTAHVEIDESASDSLRSMIKPWIEKCADAVFAYYGRFPVPRVRMHMPLSPGAGIRGGQSFPGDTPLVRIALGRDTNEHQLMHEDWVMVHEMTHLAFPWLNLRHNWMAEGLAVYVESIARVQAGHLPPEQIWSDFTVSMPKGLPKQGEGGLDQTRTWGRTYWGGALFCLICDVRIRQSTGNRVGLQHALRAINAERDFRREWPFRETLELGDAATGESVLIDTYDEMRETPVSPDLDRLWQDLGIRRSGQSISLDDDAPMASIRRAITSPVA